MPILEASEAEAVLSLDLSQVDPLHGFEIHNSELKPASVVHLRLSDITRSNKHASWLKVTLSGSAADIIINGIQDHL